MIEEIQFMIGIDAVQLILHNKCTLFHETSLNSVVFQASRFDSFAGLIGD